MSMRYEFTAIQEHEIPVASAPLLQHLAEVYAGETNKVVSVWRGLDAADLDFKPHARSSTVRQILEHQLLSERRFFAEFLGSPEPPPSQVLPEERTVSAYTLRMEQLARPRLDFIARQDEAWWLTEVPFFDVVRSRIWIFWRRILHTSHHRTQLTTYLRLREKAVPPTYGPTADITWSGADPTLTVDAAGRKPAV